MPSINDINVRRKDIVYSDINFAFTPNPLTGDISRTTNEEAVKQAIKNIVLTDRYERICNPGFGCDVRKLLFENFSGITITLVRKMIIDAVANFEPRCNILDVKVDGDPDSHGLTITVIFSLINKETPTVLSFYLTRVR